MRDAMETNDNRGGPAAVVDIATRCFQCGTCTSACRATGLVPGWSPVKAIRAIAFGNGQAVADSRWPWVCTLCGRCQYNCPQAVQLLEAFRQCRGMRPADKVPGVLHRGVMMNLERGNNLGIPRHEMLDLLAKLGMEMEHSETDPCPGFYVPVDKVGADIIVTINSKEPFGEPDDMKFWWKIFYAAREDWTVSSTNWDGVMWGLFCGNDEALKIQVGRVVENARRLKVKTILYPE